MKKLLFLIVTILIALTLGSVSVAYAEENSDYKQDFAYKFVQEFTTLYPDRKAGIQVNSPWDPDENGSESLQGYLRRNIVELSNGKIAPSDVTYQSFYVTEQKSGYNIEARLDKQGTDKQIIIGAHYDSEGKGANDNASGVAALMKTVSVLSADTNKLPCDVVFVLFDNEEAGMVGSYNYVSLQMSQADKENTLVMFNMDSIANGDNLYVWCENKHTALADLIISKSDKLVEKPYAKGTYNLDNGLGYGYTETPQNSDHTPFRMAGIPTALFFSGTYSADLWSYKESENQYKNTMNTSSDTLENLDEYSGAEFVAKINATADAIYRTVTDVSFVTTAETQRSQLINYGVLGNPWWASLICGVILVAAVVLAVFYYRKLQKGAILGTAEIKNNKVFSTPDANDIFKFDDKKANDKPSVEDVFTFDDKKKK